jgi:hypothetical protein
VSFANIGSGLISTGPDEAVGAFAIAGADRVWHWANARVVGDGSLVAWPRKSAWRD